MPQKKREFRRAESYEFERIARDAVQPFLERHGIAVLEDTRRTIGKGQSQVVHAKLPDGTKAGISVRLCWRKSGRHEREHLYSAAQLRASRLEAGWDATLEDITRRYEGKGITHVLLFQRNRTTELLAALIPVEQVAPIWHAQREASDHLIAAGKLGRTRKNHAENGRSPTLWLQDDRTPDAHEVPDVLWSWPGVIDVMRLPGPGGQPESVDDTFDDLNGVSADAGSDGAERTKVVRSAVKRDPKVRSLVRVRAGGRCERCGDSRAFAAFLDVHHVMGVEKSDRSWTCVALCPNCHREAHFSPDAEIIRRELIDYAVQFKGCT